MIDLSFTDNATITFTLAIASFHASCFVWLRSIKLYDETHNFLQKTIKEIDRLTPEFSMAPPENRDAEFFRGRASIANRASALRAPLSGLPCLAWKIGFGHPFNDDFTIIKSTEEHGSVPFLIEGESLIILEQYQFTFSSAGHLEQRDFPTGSLHPARQRAARKILKDHRLDHTLKKHGRFHEWILPLDAQCVITGTPRKDESDYRNERVTELSNALILVAHPDDGPAMVERFRRIRVAALLELQQIDRKSMRFLYLTLVGVVLSIVFFRAFFIIIFYS